MCVLFSFSKPAEMYWIQEYVQLYPPEPGKEAKKVAILTFAYDSKASENILSLVFCKSIEDLRYMCKTLPDQDFWLNKIHTNGDLQNFRRFNFRNDKIELSFYDQNEFNGPPRKVFNDLLPTVFKDEQLFLWPRCDEKYFNKLIKQKVNIPFSVFEMSAVPAGRHISRLSFVSKNSIDVYQPSEQTRFETFGPLILKARIEQMISEIPDPPIKNDFLDKFNQYSFHLGQSTQYDVILAGNPARHSFTTDYGDIYMPHLYNSIRTQWVNPDKVHPETSLHASVFTPNIFDFHITTFAIPTQCHRHKDLWEPVIRPELDEILKKKGREPL